MAGDLSVLWRLVRGMPSAGSHQDRLEGFYGGQAKDYDQFRERLLQGRGDLLVNLPLARGARIAEFGGGTGRNLEFLGDRLRDCAEATVVDLCRPLLAQADRRISERGWTNVRTVNADVCTWRPEQPLDAIYFSYCLTMVPDWWRAAENAIACLKPGGVLGVVDFYVSRKEPDAGLVRHGGFARHFWPLWFAHDGVRPSQDHLPWMLSRLERVHLAECTAKVPYLPVLRVPYYRFIGRKPAV
jgi:S-adenosylmethionine-diacylgycerolhomoserine-N-methlytransferase